MYEIPQLVLVSNIGAFIITSTILKVPYYSYNLSIKAPIVPSGSCRWLLGWRESPRLPVWPQA